ncbi:hypothetical protein HPB48_017444 [Haemaphysalis longicornis]|uniref:Uncharacterized protein n=1 Tax=Haemaphysalis longicornis TaxID=44386 RepID=A0A9J6G9G5_HAELO|nr:hypothetical protein HPB48_017444 [Haemaphysalis longicornis]
MSKLDPAELQQIIHSMAEDPQLAKYLVLKLSRSSNALILPTCDTKQAARLLRIQKLPLSLRPHLHVISHQVPASGMSRGVIHGCRPCETYKTLMKALGADMEEIVAARPMGRRGTILITFASPRPPREVFYWSFRRTVPQYEQRALVCLRCHHPGLKAATCPAGAAVCVKCGKQHGEDAGWLFRTTRRSTACVVSIRSPLYRA